MIDDAMIASIPVPSMINMLLLGIANGDLIRRWDKWLARQIKEPDVSTTGFCSYNGIEPIDIYNELFERLHQHFLQTPLLNFLDCFVFNVEILYLEDFSLNVKYHVKYRNTRILR